MLRLNHEQGLLVREVALRLKLRKTTVATYLLRPREAGLNGWTLPAGRGDDRTLKQALFQRVGRPPRDLSEPDWPKMVAEMKRKGVTLVLLWEEYRATHPDRYGYGPNANHAVPPQLRYMGTTQRRASSALRGSILGADKGSTSNAD